MTDERQAGRALDALEKRITVEWHEVGFAPDAVGMEPFRRLAQALKAAGVRDDQPTPTAALEVAADVLKLPRRWLAVKAPPVEWRGVVREVHGALLSAMAWAEGEGRRCDDNTYWRQKAEIYAALAALLTEALKAMGDDGG